MDQRILQKRLRDFAAERNWTQFHSPKNLAMALMVEAAELAELFQWKTPDESWTDSLDPDFKTRIGEEVADVLLYLLQFADHTGIDLSLALEDKLEKNAAKYPVPEILPQVEHESLRPSQTHVLVDWENVQPKDIDIRVLVPDVTDVWVFHGPSQKRMAESHHSFGDALTLVPISRSGKNSLDFHLSYYVGYISSRNPNAKFVVVANDQGYGPMLEHAKGLGFVVSQIGFGAQAKPPKKAAAKKATVQKTTGKATPTPTLKKPVAAKVPSNANAPAKKKAAASKKGAVAGGKTTPKPQPKKAAAASGAKAAKVKTVATAAAIDKPTPKPTPKKPPVLEGEKAYAHVLASLKKSKNKPARKARLYGAVKSLLGAEKPDDPVVERTVQRLMQEGHLVIDAGGAVIKTP